MNIIFSSSTELKYIVNVFSDVLETILIICSKNNICLTGIDPSHISLLNVNIDINKLEKYEYNSTADEIRTLINVKTLEIILKTCDNSNYLSLCRSDKNEKLVVEMYNNVNIKIYELPILIDEIEPMVVPDDLEYDSIVNLSSKLFHTTCSSMQSVTCEDFELKIKDNTLTMNSNSDLCTIQEIFKKNEENSEIKIPNVFKIIKNENDNSCKYGLKLVAIFSKLKSISDVLTIHVSEQYPLCLEYCFSTGKALFYVAPKIDD